MSGRSGLRPGAQTACLSCLASAQQPYRAPRPGPSPEGAPTCPVQPGAAPRLPGLRPAVHFQTAECRAGLRRGCSSAGQGTAGGEPALPLVPRAPSLAGADLLLPPVAGLGCPRAARPAWLDRGAGCSGRLHASGLMKCGETPPDTSAGVKGAGGRPGRLPGVLSGPGVSDARLVAVEGRDVEHVAVCAHPHGLHLPVAGQRGRVRGAARAEDLEGAAGQSGRGRPPAASRAGPLTRPAVWGAHRQGPGPPASRTAPDPHQAEHWRAGVCRPLSEAGTFGKTWDGLWPQEAKLREGSWPHSGGCRGPRPVPSQPRPRPRPRPHQVTRFPAGLGLRALHKRPRALASLPGMAPDP